MIFSMDGFRKNLSRDCESLRGIVQGIVNGEFFDQEDLIEAANDVITASNVINCVSSEDDPHFNDISELEVKHVDE